jgi:hypothetical protein
VRSVKRGVDLDRIHKTRVTFKIAAPTVELGRHAPPCSPYEQGRTNGLSDIETSASVLRKRLGRWFVPGGNRHRSGEFISFEEKQ